MRITKKIIKGKMYYYLEKTIRIEKPKTYSIYLGTKIPEKRTEYEKKLINKIYLDLVGKKENLYVTKQELIDAEILFKRYLKRTSKLTKTQKNEKEEIDTINFVYTTLSTEGVPITRQDAKLAYKISEKKVKNIRDENLKVSLDMIKGLRKIKESKKGISKKFILELHSIIMGEYEDKFPGILRKKQVYIYLRDSERFEEIRYRPPEPKKIQKLLDELIVWYNSNVDTLNSIELAAILHFRFYKIHPFIDGNKRISRLLLNKALIDNNKEILNISKNKEKYFDSLINCVENNDEKPFIKFLLNEFKESCK